MGAQMVREVASMTNDLAGDGMTTATVLAASIMREGLKLVAAGMNPMDPRLNGARASDAAGPSVVGVGAFQLRRRRRGLFASRHSARWQLCRIHRRPQDQPMRRRTRPHGSLRSRPLRSRKWSSLRAWGMKIEKSRGMARARVVTCHCDFPPRGIRVRPSRGRTDEASTVHGRADHWRSARA